jgi:hypothetical protein
MVPIAGESLEAASVDGWRVGAADIAAYETAAFAKRADCPGDVFGGEEAVFPIGNGVLGAEAIHVDGDVHVLTFDALDEGGEAFEPGAVRHAIEAALGGRGLALGPGVDFEPAGLEGGAVAEEAGGEGELEVAAAPDADLADVVQFQRAVDPGATAPFGGANVPVGVIVKGDESEGLGETAEEDGGEVVEVAGAVEDERGELARDLFVKGIDEGAASEVAEARTPGLRVVGRHLRDLAPGAVEIEMGPVCGSGHDGNLRAGGASVKGISKGLASAGELRIVDER